jgi:hypothetical protein
MCHPEEARAERRGPQQTRFWFAGVVLRRNIPTRAKPAPSTSLRAWATLKSWDDTRGLARGTRPVFSSQSFGFPLFPHLMHDILECYVRVSLVWCNHNDAISASRGLTRTQGQRMAKKPKPPLKTPKPEPRHYCLCDCPNCEIGAHERCSDPRCHGAKWGDLRKRKEP